MKDNRPALQMVDLRTQYQAIKEEVDTALQDVLDQTAFIRGPVVDEFECSLAGYLDIPFVHGVANGTDALQVAMMALGIGPGDEVITTAFTFVATAEAAALLGAVPVFVDIDPDTYNIDPGCIEALITEQTKAIVPVHIFGQPADMDPILEIAKRHGLAVIEDNAQGVGSTYKGQKTGGLGTCGTLSFFPSKNLGCYGDGGAVLTQDEALYHRMKLIANHGSARKYHNEVVGVNSRLDGMQAAVLKVKLKHLDAYTAARVAAADRYDRLFAGNPAVVVPHRDPKGTHVFHQYTLRIKGGRRDALAVHLKDLGIPHAVYYPVPLQRLPVYADGAARWGDLTHTNQAAAEVISLPMHTELDHEQQGYLAGIVNEFLSEVSV
ncbi:MAG: UDP-2-acetamido-2-deoxy-ribo-hexuluronate aminotransferase [Rhodothermales bacterium]|jgi:UDP-2-acetamido-2-deoxy-ribo-hexuluronate aminotransferase